MRESGKTNSGDSLLTNRVQLVLLAYGTFTGVAMLQPEYRSVMRLMPGDEKRIALAQKGILLLDNEIDDSSFNIVTINLIYMVSVVLTPSPIWIILNSPGGSVAQGFGIYDAIQMLVRKGKVVNILGLGHVASMATAVMQAGTRRYSTPLTQFLVHQIRSTIGFFGMEEEVNQGRERQQEMDRINDIAMGLIANRAGMGLEEIKRLSEKKDFWLDPVSAKNFGKNGLIDEIITELPF